MGLIDNLLQARRRLKVWDVLRRNPADGDAVTSGPGSSTGPDPVIDAQNIVGRQNILIIAQNDIVTVNKTEEIGVNPGMVLSSLTNQPRPAPSAERS